jgi:ceramide glucosyltransferase
VTIFETTAFGLTILSSAWTALGAWSVHRATRPSDAEIPLDTPAPVTVLKPLAGADPSLGENLRSFFEQDHPDYELVFGVEAADDPALEVVRALLREYPEVRGRIVVHETKGATNPKVRNLLGMMPHAEHDLVLVSDSNVRAPRSYLREAVRTLTRDPSVGLVTHLFVGEGAATLAAQLEAVQLTGFVAAGAAWPTCFGDAAVIGKSMLFSKSELAQLGGLDRVRDVLAEDYVIGKMFQHAGRKVALGSTVLTNVIGRPGLRTVFDRQLRWSMLRWRLRPQTHVLEPVSNPLVILPMLAMLVGGWAFAWYLAMVLVRDAYGAWRLGSKKSLVLPIVLAPLRDLLAFVVWLVTPLKRHVRWRGHRVRVGAGTLLYG